MPSGFSACMPVDLGRANDSSNCAPYRNDYIGQWISVPGASWSPSPIPRAYTNLRVYQFDGRYISIHNLSGNDQTLLAGPSRPRRSVARDMRAYDQASSKAVRSTQSLW